MCSRNRLLAAPVVSNSVGQTVEKPRDLSRLLIQIVKVDGPPGKTLEEVKKHMLDELRKLTRSGPDASPFV